MAAVQCSRKAVHITPLNFPIQPHQIFNHFQPPARGVPIDLDRDREGLDTVLANEGRSFSPSQ
jgi:hypothetical protein